MISWVLMQATDLSHKYIKQGISLILKIIFLLGCTHSYKWYEK